MIGYEEVGVQGLVVGLNVVLKVFGKGLFVVDCFEGYIGVMIDDLIICGIIELYWMFIFWVEYCLFLCVDNVDQCFILIGIDFGCVLVVCKFVFESWMEEIVVVCELF